jgi:hypothetical protein
MIAIAATAVTVVAVFVIPARLLPGDHITLDAFGAVAHGALAVEEPPAPRAPGRHRGVLDTHVLEDVQVDDAATLQPSTSALRHPWEPRRPRQGYPAHARDQSRILHPSPKAEGLGVLPTLAAILDVVDRARPPDYLLRRRLRPCVQRQVLDAKPDMLAQVDLLSPILQAPGANVNAVPLEGELLASDGRRPVVRVDEADEERLREVLSDAEILRQ